MNIPEGYKLVPIYPTDDMVSAVIDLGRIDPDDIDSIWSGMIENSPFICESNSRAYDEAKERDLFELQITKIAKEKNYHFMKNLLNRHAFDGSYLVTWVDMAWLGWSECAKSRARSAE